MLSCKLWNSHTVQSENVKESEKLCGQLHKQKQLRSPYFQRLNLNLPMEDGVLLLFLVDIWILNPCRRKPYSQLPFPNCCATHSILLRLSSPQPSPWLSSILSLSPWQSHTVTLQLLMQQLSGSLLRSNCTAKDISQGHRVSQNSRGNG